MSKQLSKANKLTVKDMVTTGIFSTIFTVFMLLGGVFFATNPVLTFLMPLGAALLPGPVYLLLSAKVPKKGSITILGILVGIFMFITGMHWSMVVGFMVLGIIADIITASGKYKNFKLTIIGYSLFMLGTIICAVISGLIGKKLLRKQFRKAGIVAWLIILH